VTADLIAKPGNGGFGRFEAKRGNDGFGRFADKAGSEGFGRFESKAGKRRFWRFGAKGGIDRIGGKSEIAEGRSDLRESVIRNALLVCGCQSGTRRAGAAKRREVEVGCCGITAAKRREAVCCRSCVRRKAGCCGNCGCCVKLGAAWWLVFVPSCSTARADSVGAQTNSSKRYPPLETGKRLQIPALVTMDGKGPSLRGFGPNPVETERWRRRSMLA
jgi:hypothetical protein